MLSLEQKLRVVGRSASLSHYLDLKDNPFKIPGLQQAMASLDVGRNCRLPDLIWRIVQMLLGTSEFMRFTYTGRDIVIKRIEEDYYHGSFSNNVAHIFFQRLTPDDTEANPHAPDLSLLSKQGRFVFQVTSAYDLFDLFMLILDAEVQSVQEHSASQGILTSKPKRSAVLEDFYNGKASDNHYLSEALHCHKNSDLDFAVQHLARALYLWPTIHKKDGSVRINLCHTRDWKMAIGAEKHANMINVSIQGEVFSISCDSDETGRHALVDLFKEIIRAYDAEVKIESNWSTMMFKHLAWKLKGQTRSTDSKATHAKLATMSLKRKHREDDVRISVLENNARRLEDVPHKKQRIGKAYSSIGIARDPLRPSPLANEYRLSQDIAKNTSVPYGDDFNSNAGVWSDDYFRSVPAKFLHVGKVKSTPRLRLANKPIPPQNCSPLSSALDRNPSQVRVPSAYNLDVRQQALESIDMDFGPAVISFGESDRHDAGASGEYQTSNFNAIPTTTPPASHIEGAVPNPGDQDQESSQSKAPPLTGKQLVAKVDHWLSSTPKIRSKRLSKANRNGSPKPSVFDDIIDTAPSRASSMAVTTGTLSSRRTSPIPSSRGDSAIDMALDHGGILENSNEPLLRLRLKLARIRKKRENEKYRIKKHVRRLPRPG